MTSYGYEDALARRAASASPLVMAGSSGYFARRAQGLDPALFQGDRLRPEVRRLVLATLYRFWAQHYHAPQSWSTAWIAGSGVTTAWNADREAGGAPGDLDVLIGVHYPAFFAHNPRYAGNSEVSLAAHFNQELHDGLWGSTDHTVINGSVYELTYYVNPGGSDITAINPYAAYNVSDDSWTVHPVAVPDDFSAAYFNNIDRQKVQYDQQEAIGILGSYNMLLNEFGDLVSGSPQWVNKASALHDVVRRGAALFDEIHDGRHVAFAPGGRGYFDPANYRWQAGKGNGTVPAMRALKQLDQAAHRDIGAVCSNPDHLLLLAALANGGQR